MNKFIIHTMKFALIAAAEKKNGIGKNNTLVWNLPADMKHFTKMTSETSEPSDTPLKLKKNAVIMGRNTWDSLPEKHRPLKNRLNIILSRDAATKGTAGFVQLDELWADSFDTALEICRSQPGIEKIFVIGGAKLYADAIQHPDCQTIHLTRLEQTFDCDTFFPVIDETVFQVKERSGMQHENGIDFEFLTYERR